MSREIKFRFYVENVKKIATWEEAKKDCDRLSLLTLKGFIPMQFTGLKDKNGVDIYEGDILENKKSLKGNFFVKFNCGGYDAVYKNNFTLCLHPVLSDFEGAAVIGNIYENPELLKP